MTDKQIIIHGVDVSGCKYYLFREKQPKGERCCGIGLVDCNNNDCLYKKYKRKEQECEKLKEEKQGLIKDWEEKKNLGYEIACKNEKLKQTLKEIKERLNSQVWRIGDDKTIEKINQIISEII